MLISWLYGDCVISISVEDALFTQVAIGTRFKPLSNRVNIIFLKTEQDLMKWHSV